MSFEELIVSIKKLYATLTSKDVEVILTYKGTAYGVSKPWQLKIDAREVNSVSHEKAAMELFLMLKKELEDRITFTERQAKELKQVFSSFPN